MEVLRKAVETLETKAAEQAPCVICPEYYSGCPPACSC